MLRSLTKYMLLLAAVALCQQAAGQSIAAFKHAVSRPDSAMHGSLHISENGSAANAVRTYDALVKPDKVRGYRIRIFFDNGQNARTEAMETRDRFRQEFPGIPTYLAYENPSYIVTVGNCLSLDEALILWNRVRHSFSTAFLWRGDIPMDEVLRKEKLPEQSRPTDSLRTVPPQIGTIM